MAVFVGLQLWRAISKYGQARRIYLATPFARQCHEMRRTDTMQAALEEFAWARVKPGATSGLVPKQLFTFVDNSMLVQDFSLDSHDSAGRRLSLKEIPWQNARPPSLIIRYVYRQFGHKDDYFANESLQKVFALWFEFMQAQLVLQEAG